ncbi:probable disease resistance protein At4g27220 [Aristolochia californica]|uniref:probable disease resistance protein At4g27220 n=1 Tax=Aristolochia californica TaxID=171875 RepID=UPI0035DCAAB1
MTKINVQLLINEAQRRHEEILEHVNDWMEKVARIAFVVEGLEEKANENRTCLMGQCPNLSWWYQLGRKSARTLAVVQRLKHRGDLINRVSYSPSTPVVEPIRTLDNAEELQRGKFLLEEIMEVLYCNDIRSIGVHGMGGIGKTTLVKSLNNKLQGTQLFNKVVMVNVSRNLDVRRIQQQIADRLDIMLDHECVNRRANQLVMALKGQQRVLIILDDVWEQFEIYELGILLSLLELKLCANKRVWKKFWGWRFSLKWIQRNLFTSKTGGVASNPDLLPFAKQIVSKCKGSPLAIVTIGSVLRGHKDVTMWHGTLIKLQSPEPSDQEVIMGQVMRIIRISYDHLRDEKMRKCFLFCCLFPGDYDIPLQKLQIYGVGEGFLKSHKENLSECWKLLEFYVENLKNHNLLLDSEYPKHVRLHDVVRETSKLIAQNNELGFVFRAGLGLSKCPIVEKPQDCLYVSLMHNEITRLSEQPECPKLRTLLLQENFCLEDIPNTFFKGMPDLVNLDLSCTNLKMLPPSLTPLRNLQTLVLDNCMGISDISIVGSLRRLEILSVKYTGIKQLQKELAELTNLKFLDLRGNYHLKRAAPSVLSSMVNLQVLYMWDSFVKWDAQGKGGSKNASFMEVASLHSLTDLYLSIANSNFLYIANPWPAVERFNVVMVDGVKNKGGNLMIPYYDNAQFFATYSKTLHLFDLLHPFPNWVNYLIERTEVLLLARCANLKSLPSFVTDNSCLAYLQIGFCDEMEHLINAEETDSKGLASLKEVYLRKMVKLEKICHGLLPSEFLRDLQVLEVRSCEKLIFQLDHIEALRSLETLTIDGCHEMEHLIRTTEAQHLSANILVCLKKLTLRNMKKIKKLCHGPLPSRFLTNLQVIRIQNCKQMTKDVFSCSQLQNLEILEIIHLEGIDEMQVLLNLEGTSISPNVFQNLETLHIVGMNKIKEVLRGLFPVEFVTRTVFQNLQLLYISHCNVLRNLFAINVALCTLRKLKSLYIHHCKLMEVILVKNQEEEFELQDVVLPRLTHLSLESLPELRGVCNVEIFPCFPLLESIVVVKCPKLKRLPLKQETTNYLKQIRAGRKWFESLQQDMGIEEEAKSHMQSLFKVHWSEAEGAE